MVKRLREKLRLDPESSLSTAQHKITLLPEAVKLRNAPNDNASWPIYQCENVFILPGIPELFQQKFTVIVEHFLSGQPKASAKVKLIRQEIVLISGLYCLTVEFAHYLVGIGGR